MRIYTVALTAALTLSASSLMAVTHAEAADQSLFAPPASTGSCAFKKTEFSASTPSQQTASASFVNLGDGGSISFTQKKAGCVAGTFFANVGNTLSGDNVHLQVLLDGATECAPLTTGDYVFANADVDFSSHAVGFFCGTNIGSGSHTIQVQWSVGIGGTAQMYQHMLEVNHA
ncbi:MAG TPA: hypothetical protein VHY79_12250 [Rhizomicrobium sp.]|nr:hypothetical protein [Rhizomicrobium sp.]